jgi:cobaltochelatase CobN
LCAWAGGAVEVAVITRYPQPFRDAFHTFAAKYGKDTLNLRLLDGNLRCQDLETARVVYVHEGSWTPQMTQCLETAQAMEKRGAIFGASMGSVATTYWQVKSSPALEGVADYIRAGGPENLLNVLALLYKAGGGRAPVQVGAVSNLAETGIYHPKAPAVFDTLREYLAWYKSSGLMRENAPLVGVTFFRSNYAYGDLAHIDALIAALERRGIGAVAAFAWPLRKTDPLLFAEGKPAVRLLLCLNLLMGNPDDAAFLAQHGLRAINLATTTESREQWMGSPAGLPPQRLGSQINTPERAGATEPLLIATTEKQADGKSTRLEPVADRIETAAARARRWIALADKPNAEKRVALIYFNNPPGKATLGASYLNLIPSLANVLARLQREGYRVDARVPDEEQLKRLLMLGGRNVGEYAPGELDALLRDGHVALLPLAKYEEWYRELPAEFRAFTERTWGPPSQAKQMTVRAEGKLYFVIPGIRLGNIFLGPQPLRGAPKDEAGRQHDPNHPVPHSYIACYLWYRNQFGADALVHMGRHGTVEWLPGKAVAQAGSDSGEVLIGDLPHAYYYVVDGGGEFLQAKRRSGAVIVSHLTPLLVGAGIPPDHRKLHDAIENRARVLNTNESLKKEYETEIVAEVRRLNLDRQLGFSIEEESTERIVERAEEFLHDVEAQPIPMGMHTIGATPGREVLRQAVAKFIESAFSGEDAKRARPWAERWAEALVERKELEGPEDLLGRVRNEAKVWLTGIEESPSQELLRLIEVLRGRYLPTGVSGDPLRSPAAVPTGRNMHDLDPRAFPTKAAWEVGQRMARKLLEQWVEKSGKYPEKLSFVLWYGETSRHQGIAEAQALSLLGVEPVWNGRGHVDDVRLIPAAKLGRPRVDVVLTMSGLYRDGMPEKAQILDKAVRLAASAPDDNPVRRNTRRVEEALVQQGVDAGTARTAAAARVFGPAPGAFGVGISGMMESSRDQGDRKAIGEAYLSKMGYAYTGEMWGKDVRGNLREQLRDNQGVIHSRSTNLYGVLDNDDTYQFAAG